MDDKKVEASKILSDDLINNCVSIRNKVDLLRTILDKCNYNKEYKEYKKHFDYNETEFNLKFIEVVLEKVIYPEFKKLDVYLRSQLCEQA